MSEANLSPAKLLVEKRDRAKKLASAIYNEIFDFGVEETALKFGVKPEEAVKLAYQNLRKNERSDFGKFEKLAPKEKIAAVCDKIMQIGSLSEAKIYENSEKFAKKWEVVAAKYIFKERLKRENID
ncbi:MAG: hypothetical protein FWE23_04350 [Chitinivibrionia bacterium]|nr:hypothetical protein [Chitinivibrionia bacterium]